MSSSRSFAVVLAVAALALAPAGGRAADAPRAPATRGATGPVRFGALGRSYRQPAPAAAKLRLPATPPDAVRALAEAYAAKSLAGIEALLAEDFHFHTSDTAMARLINVDRAEEIGVARAIFRGNYVNGKLAEPPADSIRCVTEGFGEYADPEHPDSTSHYRTVTVEHYEMDVYLPEDTQYQVGSEGAEIFYVVRGDAALLVPSQAADSTRWYIRRWFENIAGLTASLERVEGDCHQPDAPAPAADRGALLLGIHPLGNPACPALDISCDLPRSGPALIEVFDVMGRRMTQHSFDVAAPGTMRLQAGAGAHLAPGAYWVRLSQASQSRTQMVVVAR